MRLLATLPISSNLLQNLNKNGFFTTEDIKTPLGGILEEVAEIVRSTGSDLDALKKSLEYPKVYNCWDLLQDEMKLESIPTFSEALDDLLKGGVRLTNFLQISGAPGTGKTQLCFQLCIDVQIPRSLGGLEGEAIFMDTDSTFSKIRLEEMVQAAADHCNNLEGEEVSTSSFLNGIHYRQVCSIQHFMTCLYSLEEFIEKHKKVKLIVVDSFTFPFLTLTNLIERTRKIAVALNLLHKLAKRKLLAVVMTNHLTTRVRGLEEELKPALGDSLAHQVPEILILGKRDGLFSAHQLKSALPSGFAINFEIFCEGVRDNP